jgi:hypothetical protein
MSISPRLARRWLAPVLLAFMTTAGGSSANDGILTWIVQSISFNEDGDVIPASAMQVPQVGTALATGQQISTSAGQHMVLVNGRDLVEIKANSTVVIGDDDAATPTANLNLVTGTVHVEVGKRAPGKTFTVGAPYLVATVKGTQFDVTTSSAGSTVSVREGVVGVSSTHGGDGVDVTPGNTASVKRGVKEAPSVAPTSAESAPGNAPSATDTQSARAKARDTASTRGSDAKSGGSDSGGSAGSDTGGSDSSGSGSGEKDADSSSSGGAVGDSADAVGGAVSDTTDKVGDAVSGTTDTLGGAVGGSLGDTVSGVGDAVDGTVSGVGDTVGTVVDGVGGLLGGALDGSDSGSGGLLRDRK